MAKAFFDLSPSLIIDLLEFSCDTALLLEQTFDVANLALGLPQSQYCRSEMDAMRFVLKKAL